MFRGAILGAGNVALLGHVPGWQERRDVTIVAAADARPEAEAAVRTALPGARFYLSAEELYAKETLDFVDVAAPPATHAGLAGQALERSLHVLCEKPLVLSSAELHALTALAARKERALVTVHNWLYAEPVRKTREIVASGAVGDVRRVAWSVVRKEPARVASSGGVNWRLDPSVSGGGISVDHGWHALYAVRSLLLDDWTSVSARFEKRRFTDLLVEDTATLSLRSDRVWAEIFLTWAGDERSNRVEVEGSRGRVIV
ncbi:MAG TPA: Gfo/Idh/MocA family oxidoreductase, partial [Thermoanaerobaculia bacterium]|nr:Gfo/Idh/MocA family oxidoreductase [Thermoanaerobaculia bacterium]